MSQLGKQIRKRFLMESDFKTFFPGDMQHRGAGDVTRWQHPQSEAITVNYLPKVHPLQPCLCHIEASPQQLRRQRGAKRLAVPREMIGMSVGYEGEFLCVPRIQPEIQLREMNSTVKNDFDHSTILTVTGQPANISSR